MLDAGFRVGQLPRAAREPGYANAAGFRYRAGGYALSLFTKALHGLVLRALAGGPMRLAEVRKEIGGPAQTTLRGNLENLVAMGALEKRPIQSRVGMVDHALTPLGHELLSVVDAIESWLGQCPDGPIGLESQSGKAAIKALVSGWDSTMLRALAARPSSLTELDSLITAFSYPALERRLAAMRLAGCVAAVPGNGGGTPYTVTEWLRQGMAPLLAAVRCERRRMAEETAPLTRIDVETILLLTVPLVAFEPHASGVAQLAVDGGDKSDWRSAGVRITILDGVLTNCSSKLEPGPGSWIRGSAGDWLDAMVEGRTDQLEVCGDRALTLDFVDGIYRALFIA